jgi:AcrR family transcriptional regulator
MSSETRPDGRDEGPSFIEAARRAQIIECAIETIAELGFGRASLAEIARRAGISKSVISYYFAGKDALIEQVVTTVYMKGAEFMIPQVQGETSFPGMLRAYIRTNIEYLRTHRTYVVALMSIFNNQVREDGSPRWDIGEDDIVIEGLELLLRDGQERGEFRADFSARFMAITIRAALDMLSPRWAAEPDFDIEAYTSELVTIFDLATRREG